MPRFPVLLPQFGESAADQEGLPIVAAEPHTFVELSHYAPSDVTKHLVYLVNPPTARRLLGFGSLDNGMLELVGPFFHINVVPFEAFINSERSFLLYGRVDLTSFNWVMRALKERGFRIEFQSSLGDKYLFHVVR